jgi:hypothetical protein
MLNRAEVGRLSPGRFSLSKGEVENSQGCQGIYHPMNLDAHATLAATNGF